MAGGWGASDMDCVTLAFRISFSVVCINECPIIDELVSSFVFSDGK